MAVIMPASALSWVRMSAATMGVLFAGKVGSNGIAGPGDDG